MDLLRRIGTFILRILGGLVALVGTASSQVGTASRQVDTPELETHAVARVRFRVSAETDIVFTFLPDLDRDGIPELWFHRPINSPTIRDDRQISATAFGVLSPGQARVLFCYRELKGPSDVKPCGDQDGDGVPDILLGNDTRSRAAILSGATGKELHTWSSPLDGYGKAVALGPDADRDGRADLVVSALNARKVQLLSSRIGAVLNAWSARDEGFGKQVAYSQLRTGDPGTIVIGAEEQLSVTRRGQRLAHLDLGKKCRTEPCPRHRRISVSWDVDGDGWRDIISWDESMAVSTINSGRNFALLASVRGVPVSGEDGQVAWLTKSEKNRWVLNRVVLSGREARLTPLHTLPIVPDNAGWSVDDFFVPFSPGPSGRFVQARTNGKHENVVTVYSIGRALSSPGPRDVELPDAWSACPFLGVSDLPLTSDEDGAILPMLSRLADNLSALTSGSERRRDAEKALVRLADPVDGMWFWYHWERSEGSYRPEPFVRFPVKQPSQRATSQHLPYLARAGQLLKGDLARPNFASRAVLRSPGVAAALYPDVQIASVITERQLVKQPLAVLAGLSPPKGGEPDVEVLFSRRHGHLYLAHVVLNEVYFPDAEPSRN